MCVSQEVLRRDSSVDISAEKNRGWQQRQHLGRRDEILWEDYSGASDICVFESQWYIGVKDVGPLRSWLRMRTTGTQSLHH